MGNQQTAQKIASSTTGTKIAKSLSLTINNQTQTPSLIYSEYANELTNSQNSVLSRERSPICPMNIKASQNWLACCFINPLMAVASPIYLFTKYNQLNNDAEVLTVFGGQVRKIPIKTAILIQKQSLCLVVIEKPLFSLGWAGLSFISKKEQILSLDIRLIAHPERVLNKETNEMYHIQKSQKIKITKLSDISEEFTYRNKGIMGATILKIVDGKPYVIGIQNTKNQMMFFSEKTFKKMQNQVKSFIRKNGGDKQILKGANLQELESQAYS